MFIIYYSLLILSIILLVFTILDKTKYNSIIQTTKFIGATLVIILSILSLLFYYISPAHCVMSMSILFAINACILGTKGAFLSITTISKYKTYKYICMGINALQMILVILFCVLL